MGRRPLDRARPISSRRLVAIDCAVLTRRFDTTRCAGLPPRYSLCLTLLLCLATLLFPLASAHAATGNGHLSGQLLNGTNHNAPMPGQTVTLQEAQGPSAQDVATATTDAQGRYSFDHLATDKTISYAVYMRYQGAQYVSALTSLDTQPSQQVNLTVYDATKTFANIAAVQVTVLVQEPDAKKGSFTVSEIYAFKNLNTRTFVGSLDASKGKPNALLFSLPRGSGKVSLDQGFDGYQAIQVNNGFATDAALPPGDSQFAFSYDVSYRGVASYDFSYDVLYPVVQFSMLVPPDIHVTSAALTSQGVVTENQHSYRQYNATGLTANTQLHAQFDGLPATAQANQQQSATPFTPWLIGAGMLALLVLGATWLVYERRRRAALAASQHVTPVANGKSAQRDREQALLRELLSLDKAYEAGKLDRAVYQQRRARTKAQLRALMSEQEASRK